LTALEKRFREAAGGTGYAGRFIDQYIMPLVYPDGLSRGMQISLGILVLTLNLCVYGLVLVRRAKRKKSAA